MIARQPIDPNERGRIGHEHWLQDYGEMRAPRRRRGARVGRSERLSARHGDAAAGRSRAGQRAPPDGRFIDFTAAQSGAPAARCARDPRLIFYDPARIADRTASTPLRERFADCTRRRQPRLGRRGVGDRARVPASAQPPDSPYEHSWHTKLLRYRAAARRVAARGQRPAHLGRAPNGRCTTSRPSDDLVLIGRHRPHRRGGAIDRRGQRPAPRRRR